MKDQIKNISVTIGACVTIITGIWYFTQPIFEQKVEDVVIEYIDSNEFKITERQIIKEVSKEIFIEFLKSEEFNTKLDEYLDRVNSNSVSLRKLLSIKMGVPQETVADKLSDLYTKDAKRLRNLLRGINNMYPELNVWEID